MAEEKTLNLFVSSPGDVQAERERVDFVVERLNAEFAGRARIRTIRWETRYYSSHETFQTQIPEAAACDLVVAIFGARLGSPLPARFPLMPSGEPYPSGTAYEVLSAIEARRKSHGVPDVYVFRRPSAPLVALDAVDRAEIEAQWRRLTGFFETWFRNRSGEFLAAFQEFSTTDEFALKVEDCLRQWLARRGFHAKGAVWDRARQGSPFPGLAAFDEGRQSVFFGRGLVVDQAIRRLREVEAPANEARRAPFLLIIGASGSGKSSLLRAGLAPRLVLPGVFPEIDLWRRAMTIPGGDPFLSLAESLLAPEALGAELARGPFRAKELLAKQLAGDPDAATAPLREALDKAAAARQAEANFEAPRPARLLLGVDQAERLLIETEAGLAQRFCALVAALARHRLATVVMALRSDAYARFQSIDALVALRDAGATLDLLPPTASELEEMTTRPVALCDPPLRFERRDGRSLAATLVADARGGDALPLLQMTLSRLGAAEAARGDGVLRFADYRGMDEAVTETANEALAGLDASARGQLPDLITGMVRDVAADPLTGAPTPVIGALDRARFETGRPERTALVEAFVAKRLVTAEGDAASQRVRPTHEALLRIWPEAVATIAEAAQLIRVRHALEPIAREWAEAAPEDKARHLDISPALLEGAQRYVARFGPEASPATRDFVAAASAAAEVRRDRELEEQRRRLADAQAIAAANQRIARRTGIGLVAALALAALAGWQWIAADAAKKDAQAQRDRAERSLALASQTADGLIFDLAQKFRAVTGMPKTVVMDILERARGLQEQLLKGGESTTKLQSNHAGALGELAVTLLALGDASGALALARQARDIYADVLAAAPDDAHDIHNLALTDRTIGDILQRQGDLDGALAAYRREQATVDRAPAKAKNDPRVLTDRAEAFEGVGAIETARGDLAGALESYREELAIAKAIADGDPRSVEARNGLAIAQRHVGDVLLKLKDLAGAAAAFDAASVVAEALARENPDDTTLQRDYSVSVERLGQTLTASHDFAGALKAFEDGEAIALAMAAKDPANLDWQYDLAIGDAEIGDAKMALGDAGGAVPAYRDAVRIDRALTTHDPTNAQWRTHLWSSLTSLGDALSKQGDFAGALDADREASTFAKAVLDRNPGDAEWRRSVVGSQERIGDALFAQGDLDGALAAIRDALAATRARASEAPDSIEAQDDLSVALTKQAGLLLAKGDANGALAAYLESDDILRKLVAGDPGAARTRARLAANLLAVGHISRLQAGVAAAAAAFKESLGLAKALVEEDGENAQWRRQLVMASEGLGDVLRDEGDAPGALDAYRAAIAAETVAPRGEGADVEGTRQIVTIDRKIGDVLATTGDPSGARAAVEDGLRRARALNARGAPDPQTRDILAAALNALAGASAAQGDFAGAKAAYGESLAIEKELAAAEPREAAWRIAFNIAAIGLGDALVKLGDAAGAIAAYRDAVANLGELQRLQGGQLQWKRDLASAEGKIGELLKANADPDGALAALSESRSALADLPQADPDAPRWRRQLAYIDNQIGALLLAKKDAAGAIAAYRESLATIEALLATDPANAQWRDDLSFTQGALGDALQAQGDAAGAESAYRAGLALAQALNREQPNAPAAQKRLFTLADRLGMLLSKKGDRAGALEALAAERDAAAALVAADANDALFRAALKLTVGKIGVVAYLDLTARDYAAALAALDKATPIAPDQNWLDFVRAASLMFLGRADEARALFLKHRGEPGIGGKSWEEATTDGFARLRANGQSDPLMDEIEALFAAPK
jgi:tetratricopeptide (TPR) repeat protein